MDFKQSTRQYYANNASAFFENTQHVDMSVLYERFLLYISKQSTIIDAGSGRDAKYFQSLGHQVAAYDASPEFARLVYELLQNNRWKSQSF